jgi:hypothetical protein
MLNSMGGVVEEKPKQKPISTALLNRTRNFENLFPLDDPIIQIPKKKSLVELQKENNNSQITIRKKPIVPKLFSQVQQEKMNSFKINLSIDDKYTIYSLIGSESSSPELIENFVLIDGKKYLIPNLGCFMFRSQHENGVDSLISNSDFEFVEDTETKFVGLKLKGSSTIIKMNQIINDIIHEIQSQLKQKFNKKANQVVVTIPMIYTSFQKEEFQKCLKKTGFQEIKLVDSTSLFAAACLKSVQQEQIILVGNWTSTHLELAVIKVEGDTIEVLDKARSIALGSNSIRRRMTRVLGINLSNEEFRNEGSVSDEEYEKLSLLVSTSIFELVS